MNYYSDFSLLRNKTASFFHSMLLELTSRYIGLQNVILDYDLVLKGHSHLVHMRIEYHFIANLHIALFHKKRARKRKGEAHLSKPCRFDVFPSQNSACIRVMLKEQLCH